MTYNLAAGSCLALMRDLDANSVDAVVTDPPYGLGFMGKEWDREVPGVPFWAEMLRVAKPGAFLLSFGGTRTFHRIACAIEDSGWELRDTLMWVYGSGFPKSKNIGGGRGTALKPAWEPIILARKPLIGTVAANVLAHGTGALNIDGCRVSMADGESNPSIARYASTQQQGNNGWGHINRGARFDAAAEASAALGRWPANLIHDGSDEVLACFPGAPGQQGDLTGNEPSSPFKNAYGVMGRAPAALARGDSGSAARFFYCAKASKTDRGEDNNHPTVKPTPLMRWLCRMVTPPGGVVLDPFLGSGSTGKAAMFEGLRFIGFDLYPENIEIALRRVSAAAREAVPA